MDHFDLSKLTAEWSVRSKGADVALYEYNSWAIGEQPDVLAYNGVYTLLYEIKVSRQDFLEDHKKDCRQLVRREQSAVHHWESWDRLKQIWGKERNAASRGSSTLFWSFPDFKSWLRVKFPKSVQVVEEPILHCGRFRYYVCPAGLIKPEEVGDWGLYWYNEKDGRFYLKKESCQFKYSLKQEFLLLLHALRRALNTGKNDNVVARDYSRPVN